jgi:hypothetical protein
MCAAIVATACVWGYLYVTKKGVSVYVTTIDDDMNKVIRGRKEILRSITYNLTPAFFSWISWTSILAVIRFLGDKSGQPVFNVVFFVGVILVCTHFNGIISRLQVDIRDSPNAHRVVHAIHGLVLGIIFTGTSAATNFLVKQIHLLQG